MTKEIGKRPEFSPRHCVACWKCIDRCPVKAITRVAFLWHRHAKHIKKSCIGCGKCVKVCPHGCFKN